MTSHHATACSCLRLQSVKLDNEISEEDRKSARKQKFKSHKTFAKLTRIVISRIKSQLNILQCMCFLLTINIFPAQV